MREEKLFCVYKFTYIFVGVPTNICTGVYFSVYMHNLDVDRRYMYSSINLYLYNEFSFFTNHYLYVLLFWYYIFLLQHHVCARWLWSQENRCKELYLEVELCSCELPAMWVQDYWTESSAKVTSAFTHWRVLLVCLYHVYWDSVFH